jgi:hypothetical protein
MIPKNENMFSEEIENIHMFKISKYGIAHVDCLLVNLGLNSDCRTQGWGALLYVFLKGKEIQIKVEKKKRKKGKE